MTGKNGVVLNANFLEKDAVVALKFPAAVKIGESNLWIVDALPPS